VIGIVAALLGTVIAKAVGVSDTKGVDWIELLFQVVLAAIGVALVAGRRQSPPPHPVTRGTTRGTAV